MSLACCQYRRVRCPLLRGSRAYPCLGHRHSIVVTRHRRGSSREPIVRATLRSSCMWNANATYTLNFALQTKRLKFVVCDGHTHTHETRACGGLRPARERVEFYPVFQSSTNFLLYGSTNLRVYGVRIYGSTDACPYLCSIKCHGRSLTGALGPRLVSDTPGSARTGP